MSRILISYLTKSGSTKEVAEKVGQILADSGHKVELCTLDQVRELEKYDGVVIGAPINGMQWLPETLAFVEANQKELENKKVAYFTLALMAYQGRAFWQKKVYKALEKPSQYVLPIDTAVFGGVAKDKPPTILRLLFGISKNANPDQRKWENIESWAENIAKKM